MTTKKPLADDPLAVAQLRAERDALLQELDAAKNELSLQAKELDAARLEAERFRETAARAQADLQNARTRMGKDAEDLSKFAAEAVLKKLLPTIDNFQRAFQHFPTDVKDHEWARPELAEWVKGVAAIEQEFIRVTAQMGLQKMDVLGKPVDPQRHEVLLSGPGALNVVTEVVEDGYELQGKVLRVAKVKIGNGETSDVEQPSTAA